MYLRGKLADEGMHAVLYRQHLRRRWGAGLRGQARGVTGPAFLCRILAALGTASQRGSKRLCECAGALASIAQAEGRLQI